MSLKRLRVVLFALPLAAAGCMSTSAGPSRELVDARAAYARAASSTATTYAHPTLVIAYDTLQAAERAHQRDPASGRERHLADLARQRSELAMARGETVAIQREGERRRAELLNATDQVGRAADAAKAQAESTQRQLQVANEQANKVTEQLQQAQDAAKREREVALQAQIDKLHVDRDRSEQERKQMQAERDKALATVREFARIQDTDERGLVISMPSQVMFKTGSARLRPAAKEKLDELATALDKLGPDQEFVIEGYTDSRGSAGVNRRLSMRRAAAVRRYLVAQGVEPDRIVARGRGEADPVASNSDPEGRAENRRVEIVVSPSAVSSR